MLVGRWAGLTLVEAAAASAVSVSKVRAIERDYGGVTDRAFKRRAGSLTEAEREDIYVAIKMGSSDAEIARELGRHRSTIGREIARNGGREAYRPYRAERRAEDQASRARDRWFITRPQLWQVVLSKLERRWSPEQISLWLKNTYPDQPQWWVSHESIYQGLYVQAKGEFRKQVAAALRTGRIKRRSHSRATQARTKATPIPNLVSISQRPAEVADRAIPGHWEGDLILGAYGRSAVATLVERTSRYGLLIKVDSKHADHVAHRLAEHVLELPKQLCKSLTWDRGTEIADHINFSIATDVAVYICDPHSPWQRGSNENWNGLVRQYLPKGTDLSRHTQADLDAIADELNTRPRKTLGVRTPAQVFADLVAPTT